MMTSLSLILFKKVYFQQTSTQYFLIFSVKWTKKSYLGGDNPIFSLVFTSKVFDFQVYVRISIFLQKFYNSKKNMGKKVTNKQENHRYGQANETTDQSQFTYSQIKRGSLREMTYKKIEKKSRNYEQKLKRFKSYLVDGRTHEILSETFFECSICLQMMVNPTMMLCGHMYCLKCLESSNAHSQRCCLCRNDQENQPLVKSPIAEKIIHQILLPASSSYFKFLCRLTDSEEWNKRRKISTLRQNLIVDFQDRFGCWQKGMVVDLFYASNRCMAKIKTKICGQDIFQDVEVTSRRIAPYTFFTKKGYLKQFAPSLPEDDFAERELASIQYLPPKLKQQGDLWNLQEQQEINQIEDNFNSVSSGNESQIDQILMSLDSLVDQSLNLVF